MVRLKKVFRTFLMIVLAIYAVACDSNKDIVGANASDNPDLLFVALGPSGSSNQVYIKTPLAVFGETSSDVDGATITIYLNDSNVSGELDAAEYFYGPNNDVIVNLRPVSSGAKIGVLAVKADGGQIYFEGVVEENQESKAIITTPAFNLSPSINETPVLDFILKTQSIVGTGGSNDVSGFYDVTYETGEFSSDCEASFVKEHEFFVDSGMTLE